MNTGITSSASVTAALRAELSVRRRSRLNQTIDRLGLFIFLLNSTLFG
jgi:hypothetical protein